MDLGESATYLAHHLALVGRTEPLFADDAIAGSTASPASSPSATEPSPHNHAEPSPNNAASNKSRERICVTTPEDKHTAVVRAVKPLGVHRPAHQLRVAVRPRCGRLGCDHGR
jgi:hypothetical protein